MIRYLAYCAVVIAVSLITTWLSEKAYRLLSDGDTLVHGIVVAVKWTAYVVSAMAFIFGMLITVLYFLSFFYR